MQQARRWVATIRLQREEIPLRVTRSRRARRYLLRLQGDGSAALTLPPGGVWSEAQAFVERNLGWLEEQFEKLARRPRLPREWTLGTAIHWRGDLVTIERCPLEPERWVRFGSERAPVGRIDGNLRGEIEGWIWMLAARELPPLVFALAQQHGVKVTRVSVRDQRARWGSCSIRGTISLNWRILQAPGFVRDYLILHELMHLREMNHSNRFWAEVAGVCPDYQKAERWLTQHSFLLK